MVYQPPHNPEDYNANGFHCSVPANDSRRQPYASKDDSLSSPSDADSKLLSQHALADLRLSPPSSAESEHYHGSKYRRAYSYKFTVFIRSLLFVLELGTCVYFYRLSRGRKEDGKEELGFGAGYVALIAALAVDGSIVTAVLTQRYHDFWAVIAFIADCGLYGLNMRAMLTGEEEGGLAGWSDDRAVWMFLTACWVRSIAWVAGMTLCIVAMCRDERKERAQRRLYRH